MGPAWAAAPAEGFEVCFPARRTSSSSIDEKGTSSIVFDLDPARSDRVTAPRRHFAPAPEPERDGDLARQDVLAQLFAELHLADRHVLRPGRNRMTPAGCAAEPNLRRPCRRGPRVRRARAGASSGRGRHHPDRHPIEPPLGHRARRPVPDEADEFVGLVLRGGGIPALLGQARADGLDVVVPGEALDLADHGRRGRPGASSVRRTPGRSRTRRRDPSRSAAQTMPKCTSSPSMHQWKSLLRWPCVHGGRSENLHDRFFLRFGGLPRGPGAILLAGSGIAAATDKSRHAANAG